MQELRTQLSWLCLQAYQVSCGVSAASQGAHECLRVGHVLKAEGCLEQQQAEKGTCTPLLGMGRLSFISATPGGKSFLYQGCRWMSGMVIRLAGSGTRMRFIRSRHSRDAFTCGGNSYSTFKIRCRTHNRGQLCTEALCGRCVPLRVCARLWGLCWYCVREELH